MNEIAYYRPQNEGLANLPLALVLFLAASPVARAPVVSMGTDFVYYGPNCPLSTNLSGGYYQTSVIIQDNREELQILKDFADKLTARSMPPPTAAIILLNANFWQLI